MFVYIAGPFTASGGFTETRNTHAAVVAGRIIEGVCDGVSAYIPHCSMLEDAISPQTADYYYEKCLRLLASVEVDKWALVRISERASHGVDLEVAMCDSRGIPVFESVDAFVDWWQEKQREPAD